MKEIPLIQTVHMLDDQAQVWFEHDSQPTALRPGDTVTIVARVYEVKNAGGYVRMGGAVADVAANEMRKRSSFTLDIAEIFLAVGEASQ